ncbi:hypothetical protein [Staphylococcus pettenkoferi]|nr:hypothetical protein [Staphylococcus pettenkoferi]
MGDGGLGEGGLRYIIADRKELGYRVGMVSEVVECNGLSCQG